MVIGNSGIGIGFLWMCLFLDSWRWCWERVCACVYMAFFSTSCFVVIGGL
uniref:Uncharacterized protein n=1 Tax=Arundo donax TaxID=35708 RepID=A0A0A9G1U3_ARUDO